MNLHPISLHTNTVKLVYKYHPRDQNKCTPYTQVVFICRFNSMESTYLETCKMWSLLGGGFYMQVVFIEQVLLYATIQITSCILTVEALA